MQVILAWWVDCGTDLASSTSTELLRRLQVLIIACCAPANRLVRIMTTIRVYAYHVNCSEVGPTSGLEIDSDVAGDGSTQTDAVS